MISDREGKPGGGGPGRVIRNGPRFKRPDQEGLPRGLVAKHNTPLPAGPLLLVLVALVVGAAPPQDARPSASSLATAATGLPPLPDASPPPPVARSGAATDGIPVSPGEMVQPIDLASRSPTGGRARPGHRHRPAAGLAGPGRAAGGPRALAAQPLHRADLLPPRRAGAGDQRPDPDGRPRLALPRHDGHPGQQLPRPAAGERLSPAEHA